MSAARSLRLLGHMIYKDIYVLRGTMLYITLLSIATPLLTARLDQGWVFLGMWTGMVGYFFAMSNCVFEDKVDGWTWMRTLPVSANVIMGAKYLSNLMAAAASAALFTAVGHFMVSRGWLQPPAVPIYYYTVLPMPVVLCFGGIVMWLSALWDYRRAQVAMFTFMMAIMLLPSIRQQWWPKQPLWAESWAAGSLHFDLPAAVWALYAGLLVLYAVLGLLAARAFARRNL